MGRGLIHIYCGEGKGKTTAAFGLAFRCAGHGEKVVILQFLKGSDTGEITAAQRFDNITVIRGNPAGKFTFQMSDAEKERTAQEHDWNFDRAAELCRSGTCRMLVLDEIMAAWDKGLLDKKKVLKFLRSKPEPLEIVMTGRNPPSELFELADYISEICKIRHPYDKGVGAREGIEW